MFASTLRAQWKLTRHPSRDATDHSVCRLIWTTRFPDSSTLTKAEAKPFERLHPKLRISPLHCSADKVTHCEGMVRISRNAGEDAPVHY